MESGTVREVTGGSPNTTATHSQGYSAGRGHKAQKQNRTRAEWDPQPDLVLAKELQVPAGAEIANLENMDSPLDQIPDRQPTLEPPSSTRPRPWALPSPCHTQGEQESC